MAIFFKTNLNPVILLLKFLAALHLSGDERAELLATVQSIRLCRAPLPPSVHQRPPPHCGPDQWPSLGF